MSYTSRVQRQRNAHLHGEGKQEKFFFKQHSKSENSAKPAFFLQKQGDNKPDSHSEKRVGNAADQVVQKTPHITNIQTNAMGVLQRTATPTEEKIPGTNEGQIREEKVAQEYPIQLEEAEPEREDGV
jgi:hypothetical protein